MCDIIAHASPSEKIWTTAYNGFIPFLQILDEHTSHV